MTGIVAEARDAVRERRPLLGLDPKVAARLRAEALFTCAEPATGMQVHTETRPAETRTPRRARHADPHPQDVNRRGDLKSTAARIPLAAFKKGWLLPANWDIAHWFERTASGGWQTGCGKRVGGFYRDREGAEIAFKPGAHTTCRRCAAAMF